MRARWLRWCLVPLGVVWLTGCANPEPRVWVDADDDGVPAEEDCDDDDPLVYPGAPERANCADDNCDGRIDEGTENADFDGDGFCESTGDSRELGCALDPLRYPTRSEDGDTGTDEPNGIDDNCNGVIDEGLPGVDVDGDGFTSVDGDCDDFDPLVNPGAIEVEGRRCRGAVDCPNGRCYDGFCRCLRDDDCSTGTPCSADEHCPEGETCDGKRCRSIWICRPAPAGMPSASLKVCSDGADNDCDGVVDEYAAGCDDPGTLDERKPEDFARAIELCDDDRSCSLDKPCPGGMLCEQERCRRVISARFNDGADPRSRAIGATLGRAHSALISPRKNRSFVILSTGLARYDPLAPEQCPESGTEFGNTDKDPDPLAGDPDANDPSALRLELVVPTNARSFSFDFQFLTTEYPEFLDSDFNDTFWVELKSRKLNGNISFDKTGTPIRLNNAFFDICDVDPENAATAKFCSYPAALLEGTGYNLECADSTFAAGGSTGWLTTTVPVEPGETITITFTVFDKGDGILDSSVLIDNFRWELTPTEAPITAPL